jgi:hypothetical protein
MVILFYIGKFLTNEFLSPAGILMLEDATRMVSILDIFSREAT